MTKDLIYERDGKPFYSERQCPFCGDDLMIKGMGSDFIELTCAYHPNILLYIVGG